MIYGIYMQEMRYMQTDTADKGNLKIEVISNADNTPIEGARVQISYSGEPGQQIQEVQTNESGMSDEVALDTPPVEYSMQPSGKHKLLQTLKSCSNCCLPIKSGIR